MNPQNQNQNQNQNPNPFPIGAECTTTITATTTTSSNTQACAACKYQRRRCASNCPLAPFFPATKPLQDFRNAHRLFGVSNIAKTIKSLPPELREVAVQTMVYQANARAADPVGGCLRIIRELQVQIYRARAELKSVLQNLAYFRTVQEEENIYHDNNINPNFPFHDYNGSSDVGNGGGELRVGSDLQPPQENGFSTGLFDHNVGLSSGLSKEFLNLESSKGIVEKLLENHDVQQQQPVKLETESSSEKGAETMEPRKIQPKEKKEDDLNGSASLFPLTNSNA